MHPDWLLPDWPAPAGVRAVCTTRQGGVSLPPYEQLNLGLHVGDDPLHVQTNRTQLQSALNAQMVFLSQVHGTQVLALDRTTPQDGEADACFTRDKGVVCTIMVADCLPVLFTDRWGRVVAAAHAGWRGLAGHHGVGVLESLVQALTQSGVARSDLMAWLGPCIGPTAFEVGAEVRAAFLAHSAAAQACFQPAEAAGKWLANLPALARQRLTALGIDAVYGNDGNPRWCTVSQPSRFFSHRRDRVSGRMAACIWLT